MKQAILIVMILFGLNALHAQISSGGQPIGLRLGLPLAEVPVFTMPAVNTQKMLDEDLKEEASNGGVPHRFAYVFDVDYSPENSGQWTVLSNGDKVWRLAIESKGAFSLTTIFENFKLPLGAQLFLYNPDNGQILGAFTQRNNSKSGVFPTAPLAGNKMVIEYFEPADAAFAGAFKLKNVGHDYRNVVAWDQPSSAESSLTDSCFININCPQGAAWQVEKQAVCRLFFGGGATCSGALVNNTANDGRLFFLTAWHCISTQADANTCVFYFNYESPTCTGTSGSAAQTMTGATLRATHSDSDFSLMELDGPVIPIDFRPYFAGWDRRNIAPTSSVGIHHPDFMIKKIYVDNDASSNVGFSIIWNGGVSTTPPNSHWTGDFDDGNMYGGSSGSPLFNQDHRIAGQLHGGTRCTDNSDCIYGKFSYSWDTYPDTDEQLQFWLDPAGIGGNPNTLDGYNIMNPTCVFSHNLVAPLALSRKFEASNSIIATNVVTNGSARGIGVVYDAGNEIRLRPGFHAQPGCFFLATIDGCGGDVKPGSGRTDIPLQAQDKMSLMVSPNPFSESSAIDISLEYGANVTIRLFDVYGQEVASIVEAARLEKGNYQFQFGNPQLPPGLYYVTLITPEGRITRKVVKGE